MAEIVIVNPRFEVSYWGMEHALPMFGTKMSVPAASLPLLAALTPDEHHVTLIDENVEPLDFDRISQADIVGVTGMIVQRFRMQEILQELKQRDAFTVVGGPWVSVDESYFGDAADVIFVGEAEDTWPQFLHDWQNGTHQRRYEQSDRTDMTKVPCPRHDLLRSRDYMFGSVQFTRGCPFQCEFCDIIITFGRRPRLKTPAQIITELEALRREGKWMVFIVDDNLIGNKTAAKELLQHVIEWQRDQGYPMTFLTQTSIDLAEDEELLRLMGESNVQSVFIGIESPNPESLRETKKTHNLRERGGTMLDKIHRIQHFGMDVWCGMILGFDHDDSSIFQSQVQFLTEARIAHVMMGMLVAIPKTPLHARLAAEGRLDLADPPEFGTNVIPLRMSREELSEGYMNVMAELYEPEAYFDRIDSVFLDRDFNPGHFHKSYLRRHPWLRLRAHLRYVALAAVLQRRLMRVVEDRKLRDVYCRRLANARRFRRDPHIIFFYTLKCVMHYHYHRMVLQMETSDRELVNSF